MLACSFCGASLALEAPREAERLILSHTRDDKMAEATLRSHLVEKERRRPTRTQTEFSFVPFSMIEADDGGISLAPAACAWRSKESTPYPPAGEYRFLDENTVRETVVPADTADPRAMRIIHLPIYQIAYEAAGWRGHAAVVGESWQIVAEELPPAQPRRANMSSVFAAIALFAGYYALARIVPGFAGRLLAVAAAAATLYFMYAIRERARG
jgi:hypothetical protein